MLANNSNSLKKNCQESAVFLFGGTKLNNYETYLGTHSPGDHQIVGASVRISDRKPEYFSCLFYTTDEQKKTGCWQYLFESSS